MAKEEYGKSLHRRLNDVIRLAGESELRYKATGAHQLAKGAIASGAITKKYLKDRARS